MCSWSSSVATSFLVPTSRTAFFAILENSTLRRDCDLLRQVSLYLTNLFDRVLRVSPGFSTQPDSAQSKNLSAFDFATILSHRFGAAGQADILSAAERPEMANVQQIKKIVPLITCEIPFCQHVRKLVFGVDILDLNLGFQINSVKQPIKSNSVGSGYESHCWTSAFDDHLNHGFVILKSVQHRVKSGKLRVRRDMVNIAQIKIVVLGWNLDSVLGVLV